VIGGAAALVAAASLLLVIAGPATADPVNPPKAGQIVTFHCQQLGDLTVIREWTVDTRRDSNARAQQ
jgi:hypothetical protein